MKVLYDKSFLRDLKKLPTDLFTQIKDTILLIECSEALSDLSAV